jgi:gliding motility-associated-like protein
MKKLLTPLFCLVFSVWSFAQISLKIELMPDNSTIQVSMIPDFTFSFPQNITTAGQVTVKVPHGFGDYSFEVVDFASLTPDADWAFNNRLDAPPTAPSWDYLSFGLVSIGTQAYNYQAGVALPLFSFKNGAGACADSIRLFDNLNDPLISPNAFGINLENTIVVLGGGLVNSVDANFGSGAVPGTPEALCEDIDFTSVLLCDGEAYQGVVYTQNTSFEEHYTTYLGCDSGYVVEIKVGASSFATIDTAVCMGEMFNNTIINQSQVLTSTLLNGQGCDSVITYNVTALMPVSTTSDTLILPGMIFAGTAIFNDTTIVQALTGSNGCDSLHTIQVGVYQVPVTVQDTTLCQGEAFNGTVYSQSTTLVDTLTGSAGFDSLLLTNIFINPSYLKFQTIPLCQGSVYKNVPYYQDTVIIESYLTVNGCDSLIYTTLDVAQPKVFALDTAVCFGENFQGLTVTKDTLLQSVIYSVHGCDSIVYQSVITMLPAASADVQGKTAICRQDPITLTAYGGATYLWSNGETTKTIQVSSGGLYAVTATNNFGCQDVAELAVTDSDPAAQISARSPGCANGGDGEIAFLDPSGGVPPYSYSIDGGSLFTTYSEFGNLPPGRYALMMKDKDGCTWESVAELIDPFEYQLDLLNDTIITLGENVQLRVATDLFQPASIEWWPAQGLDCTDCLEPMATPYESTVYHLRLTDSMGCAFEGKVHITVDRAEGIFVPTAFSPNEDGINEVLMVYAGENVARIRSFQVFNRWGVQVFAAENFKAGDPLSGWDGYWRGKREASGAYVWAAQVEYVDGKTAVYHGTALLLR